MRLTYNEYLELLLKTNPDCDVRIHQDAAGGKITLALTRRDSDRGKAKDKPKDVLAAAEGDTLDEAMEALVEGD